MTTDITGYRTNGDGTQTLAWTEREDGTVFCDHDSHTVCTRCLDADSRLRRDGRVVRVGRWPITLVREGRTVKRRA